MLATIVGHAGYIGSHLARLLANRGDEVFLPDRDDPRLFRKNLGTVFYCAGLTADFRTRPFDTVRAHVCHLADILERANFDSLLYLSSTRVYTGAGRGDEQAPLQAGDIYNLSKLTGESLCLASGRAGVRIARLSNVIGGAEESSQNFLHALAREAKAGKIVLRDHPDSAKDYIHVDDVVQMLMKISLCGQHSLYNLASGYRISHGEWVSRAVELTACAVEILPDAVRVDFPEIEINRLRKEFGFVPRSRQELLSCFPFT